MPRIEPPHQPGDRVLRDYELQELIGSGGHAFVYRARCIIDGEEVAIKVIPEQPGRVTNVRERAKREALVLVRLDHPNIVKVIDGGETKGITYIVMEMMRGKVLRDVMHAVRRLSVREALSIAVQVAEGMLQAHRLNVIHRDLKPENVFVLKDNRVKILDFGIAKFLGYGYESTQRDMAHGTAAYMSPEQLQGLGVTDKSDVYALGTMLWEMIAGYPPVFCGVQEMSMLAIGHRQATVMPPALDEIHPEVPGYVVRLVQRSLAKKALERETSEKFLASLRQALERLSREQAPEVILDRDLLSADASPLLTPKPRSSQRKAQAQTGRTGTPQARFGPAGTEVIQTLVSPECEASEPSPKGTGGQGFPTVHGVSLFHPAPDSDLTRVPVPAPHALPRRGRKDGATADEPAQPEQPPTKSKNHSPTPSKDHGSMPIEPALSMSSTATWVTPLVPKWLVAAVAGAAVGGLFVVSPKLLNERWAPLTDSAELSELTTVESAKPDPQAVRTASALRNPNPLPDPDTLAHNPPPETEIPVATTPATAPIPTTPVSTGPTPTRSKRRSPQGSSPAPKSEPRPSRPTAPTPPSSASTQSQVRVPPEEYKSSLWLESPKERAARKKAEAQKPSPPPKTAPSWSSELAFDPEELIFK